jgi:hypothetical protein
MRWRAYRHIRTFSSCVLTADKRASLTALAELGRSRVAHPFDLWIELLEHEAISLADFEHLCRRTKNHDSGLRRMPGRVASRFAARPTD